MDIYDITASALTAQRLRLDTISSNLANVNTTRKSDGTVGAYRRKNVVFAPILDNAMTGPGGLDFDTGLGTAALSRSIPMRPSASGVSLSESGQPVLRARIQKSQGVAGAGVQVVQIQDDQQTPMKMIYNPSHPDANEEGYVEMPNVNTVTEMVDMISASRAYEANVTALQSAKQMMQSALEL